MEQYWNCYSETTFRQSLYNNFYKKKCKEKNLKTNYKRIKIKKMV